MPKAAARAVLKAGKTTAAATQGPRRVCFATEVTQAESSMQLSSQQVAMYATLRAMTSTCRAPDCRLPDWTAALATSAGSTAPPRSSIASLCRAPT